jgi:thiol-disulfide isomerase/thioredoxin
MDLLVGFAACAAVFGLVALGNLEDHQLAAGVAVIYFLAGLVRPDRGGLPLILRVVLISLFGCVAALMMVGGVFIMWAPYAVAALMFTVIAVLVRRKWSRLSATGRWSALISSVLTIALVSWLVFPVYFDFASTYISGPVTDFELQNLDGRTIASEDLKGKVILLDYWDTHCGPCRKLMPEMEKLQARYKDDPRVAILAVNAGWEPLEEAQKYVAEHDYSLIFAYDPGAQTSRAMGVWELPTTILIDTEFNYHSKHIAYEPGEEAATVAHYGELIEELLAEAG